MSSDEREISNYVQTWGGEFINAKEVSRRAGQGTALPRRPQLGQTRNPRHGGTRHPRKRPERPLPHRARAQKRPQAALGVAPTSKKSSMKTALRSRAPKAARHGTTAPLRPALMLAALLTTLLFATSTVCGYRTAKRVGGVEANFWRIPSRRFSWPSGRTFGAGFAGAPNGSS